MSISAAAAASASFAIKFERHCEPFPDENLGAVAASQPRLLLVALLGVIEEAISIDVAEIDIYNGVFECLPQFLIHITTSSIAAATEVVNQVVQQHEASDLPTTSTLRQSANTSRCRRRQPRTRTSLACWQSWRNCRGYVADGELEVGKRSSH
jgi:hypothetical protein